DLGDVRGIERLGLATGERFAVIALGTQALESEVDRRTALLKGRLSAVGDDHRPRLAGAQGNGEHNHALVGRGFVVKNLPLVPAFTRGARRGELEWTLEVRFVGRPGCGHRGRGIGSLTVDNGNVRVGLRRLKYNQILVR